MARVSVFYKLVGMAFITVLLIEVITAYHVSGLGPGFNSVKKTPVISPNRDYLPANYTHHLNLIFKFPAAPSNAQRESGIATTLIDYSKDLVRVYAFNSYTMQFVVLDLNIVTLNYRVVGVIKQYLNVSGEEHDIRFFTYGHSKILGSHDYKFGTVVISTLYQGFTPFIEIYTDDRRVGIRDAGPILINIFKDAGVESYILDLGAVNGLGFIYPLSDIYGLAHTSVRLTDDAHLLVAQTTLWWPAIYLGGPFLDYVNGNITSEIEYRNVDGVILAKVDLNSMKITNATFVYSPKYGVAARGLATSDNGFLTVLLSENGTLISKFDEDLNIEWGLTLSFNKTIYPHTLIYRCFKIIETGDGYGVLVPLDSRPLLIYLSKSGELRWMAYLDISGRITIFYSLYNSISGYKDRIYLYWHTKVNEMDAVWLTIFKTDGEVLGTYHNRVRPDAKAYLFGEVSGVLGEEKTILCRPYGYYARVSGYIDVSYLLDDYKAAELGSTDPFRDFHTNEDDLKNGLGWKIYTNVEDFSNVSYSYDSLSAKTMRIKMLGRSGEKITFNISDSIYTFKLGDIVTVVYQNTSIEFIPSFFYPVAILPDEVDFGTVHVGETKEVYLEMIWLVQLGLQGTAVSVGYHEISREDPSFDLDESFYQLIREWMDDPDVDVGKRLRVKIIFKPVEEGLHTSIFGIGQGPNGIYIWSPIGFDHPRQIIPVRGVALAEDEAITVGSSPIKLGLSAVEISAPSQVVAGSAWRETLYITNIGNAEAVFVHGIVVLPGHSIVKVEGADKVIGSPNSTSLEPFFAVVNKIKPHETRRVDLYIRSTREFADPESIFHYLVDPKYKHGAFAVEIAALPPSMWNDILDVAKDKEYLAVDLALYLYEEYTRDIVMDIASRPPEEINDLMVQLWMENPILANHIDLMADTLVLGDWMYNHTTPELLELEQSGEQASTASILPLPDIPEVHAAKMETALSYALKHPLWTLHELFFTKETLETSWEGLKGFGKGVAQALLFDLWEFEAENEYQQAGKFIGYWATNVETFLISEGKAVVHMAKALKNLDLVADSAYHAYQFAKFITRYEEAKGTYLGVQRFMKIFRPGLESIEVLGKKIPVPKVLDEFATLIGFEAEFLGPEGKSVYGNIIKLARNKKFGGWYIGIAFNPVEVREVGGKLIYPGVWHYYFLSGKLAIPKNLMHYFAIGAKPISISGPYVEYSLPIIQPLLKSVAWSSAPFLLHSLRDFVEAIQLKLATISFSADPNEAGIYPYPYITSIDDEIYATIKFENLANATAPAYNITVKVFIEGPANLSTIELWDVSHPETYDYHLINATEDKIMVTIRFTNITLPPNKDPPEGEGWLTLKLHLLNDTMPGSKLRVYADVYFDYNPPVRTNVAETTYDPNPPNIDINVSQEKSILHLTGVVSDDISGHDKLFLVIFNEYGMPINTTVFSTSDIDYEISLEPGNYTLYLEAVDKAGNINSSSINVTIHQYIQPTPTEEAGEGLPVSYIAVAAVAIIAIVFTILYLRRRFPS